MNSPEAPRAGASSIARRTEPPSTLKCGRYPESVGGVTGFPCENMYDPYGVGDSCILPCADTRIYLDVTIESWCMEFAGPRPWPKFGLLADDTAIQVYRRRGAERSLNLRYNAVKKVPLFVQDVIEAVWAVWLVTSTIYLVIVWFIASMVSGPSGPSQDLVDALAAESPTSFVTRTVLKLALCTVLASCGNYVLGYVLPFLRFFSQIPW